MQRTKVHAPCLFLNEGCGFGGEETGTDAGLRGVGIDLQRLRLRGGINLRDLCFTGTGAGCLFGGFLCLEHTACHVGSYQVAEELGEDFKACIEVRGVGLAEENVDGIVFAVDHGAGLIGADGVSGAIVAGDVDLGVGATDETEDRKTEDERSEEVSHGRGAGRDTGRERRSCRDMVADSVRAADWASHAAFSVAACLSGNRLQDTRLEDRRQKRRRRVIRDEVRVKIRSSKFEFKNRQTSVQRMKT